MYTIVNGKAALVLRLIKARRSAFYALRVFCSWLNLPAMCGRELNRKVHYPGFPIWVHVHAVSRGGFCDFLPKQRHCKIFHLFFSFRCLFFMFLGSEDAVWA